MQDSKDLDNRVNRQPTLHEFSIYALKLRLTKESSMYYPIGLCSPLNADFDGDAISVTLVPEEVKEETYNKMSPRYNRIYKKNLKNIFEFDHETLNGLAVLSEVTPEKPEDIDDPKEYYDSYAELLKDVEVNHKIGYGTPIIFNGKLGDEGYKNKKTTYGRLRLSKLVGADIDKIGIGVEGGKRINAKSAALLMSYLQNHYDDCIERCQAIQKYALIAVTKAGVATFDFATLYADTDTKTYQEIRKIADSKDLTDKQKLILLTNKYKEYEKEVCDSYSSDLKDELDRAGRVKLSSIVSINMPSLIVSGVDEKVSVTHGSLLSGFGENEYKIHAVENRSLQSIKQSGVQ